MKLKKVKIHKYKSFSNEQEFNVENDITVLVGMNESGKTSVLEAIAKTNYFQDDESFEFNTTHDYPRKEKKKMDKTGKIPEAVTCTYEIDDETLKDIENDCGKDVFTEKVFSITSKYDNKRTIIGISANIALFIKYQVGQLTELPNDLKEELENIKDLDDLQQIEEKYSNQSSEEENEESNQEKYLSSISELENKLKKYFENKHKWSNPIEEYIYREHIKPEIPKFLYYDEYFALPARISIEKLQDDNLTESESKTAKALFELADIDIEKLIQSNDFEEFKAELEATSLSISNELFEYWQTNKNLEIIFDIDKQEDNDNEIIEHILDVRVKNKGVSLSLKNRSKGFNWFFSFLVWFKKIQEDEDSNYVLLLDEPGLNLHASAQADLLRFLEDLKKDYQIIYTTHSPFMIFSDKLSRVRTVLETDKSSIISDSIQEKDPNTLFPLQAALGYDIAQNLFISKKNLLVEGVSDLIILTKLSETLFSKNREGLKENITIVPTGGLEKVATFISLLRGSKLNIVCLLDSYTDKKAEEKMKTMIHQKIIKESKIKFFHDFLDDYEKADLEDLFKKSDYLKLFNSAFDKEVKETDLNKDIQNIIIQINKYLGKDRFNHYRPANAIIKVDENYFDEETLSNFEKVFKEINKLFN